MNNFSVGQPQTIFDWVALREEFRGKVEILDIGTLSILYGLSNTVVYRDDEFSSEVEDFLSTSADPIRTRFDFAYELASEFWETYKLWDFSSIQTSGNARASELLQELHDKALKWLIDGLTLYSDQMEVMDSAFFVVSRIGNYDTFLEEDDIPLLEAAARKEISFKTSEGGRRIVQNFRDFFENMKSKDDKD